MLILLIGCNAESGNDASKRNADWVWWVDEHTGKGEWIKSGDQTTVKDGKYTKFYFNGNVYSKGGLKNGVDIDTIFFMIPLANAMDLIQILKETMLTIIIKTVY
ncbi:MAG: hypothetical protein QM530_10825 [Phycisphaerales bacterium]|nr:hypothetical protein [Phycisphaerales bacterium]